MDARNGVINTLMPAHNQKFLPVTLAYTPTATQRTIKNKLT